MVDGILCNAIKDRYEFATSDPASAERFIRSVGTNYTPTVAARQDSCRFRFTSIAIDGIQIQSLESSLSGRVTLPPSSALMVGHLLAGTLRAATFGSDIDMARGASMLLQPHTATEVEWTDLRVGMVRLELPGVEQVAVQECGIDAGGLRFLSARPRSAEAERYWQSAVRMVNREVLPNDFASQNHLVQQSVGRWLAVAMLQTFPNSAIDESPSGLASAEDRPPPAALRRAVEFMQAHAGDAITMDDIAAAARVTARSLQHGFRRTFDTTPTAYLRQVRLERAHRDLQAADASSGETVAAIAGKWGFGNVGRFAARYRETYGRAPHEVLRS